MNSVPPKSQSRSTPTLEGQLALPVLRSGASGDQPAALPRFRPQVLRSLKARPRLAALVAFAMALLLAGLALRQLPLYAAESLVYVEPTVTATISDPTSQGFDQFRYSSYMEQQLQTVTRPDVLTAALNSLPDRNEWRFPGESVQAAVNRLQKSLVVERVLMSYQLSIRLQAYKPQTAVDVVNAVTLAYLRGGHQDELTQADGRLQLVSEERDRLQTELDGARHEQARLGASLGVANPTGGTANPFDTELVNLRAQLAVARQAHDVAAAQLDSVGGTRDQQRSGLTSAADEALNTEVGLSSMKNSVNIRRAILEGQMAGLTPKNPMYKQDQDEIADLDRSLDSMTARLRKNTERRIQDKLGADLTRTADVETRLNGELSQLTTKATGAGPRLQRASELAADIERLTRRYGVVDEALRGLQLQTNGPATAHLALAASLPTAPEPNRRNLILLATLPFALLSGIAAAVIARLRDRRVYLACDLEEIAGFEPIAILPAPGDVSLAAFDEYILRLAAALEYAYRASGARVFLITGVTATTHTLPLMQALGAKLEDLRLRVDTIAAADLMTTSAETAEYQSRHPDPAGRGQSAGEGIASSKLERLKRGFDIILVDAAPLLLSAGTEYAARCADATLLVVESGESSSAEVEASLKLLSRLSVRGIALVLQDLSLAQADGAFQASIRAVERRNILASEGRGFLTKRDVASAEQIRERTEGPAMALVCEPYDTDRVAGTAGEVVHAAIEDAVAADEPALRSPKMRSSSTMIQPVVSAIDRDRRPDTVPEIVTALPPAQIDLSKGPELERFGQSAELEDALVPEPVYLLVDRLEAAFGGGRETVRSEASHRNDSHQLASPDRLLHLVVASAVESDPVEQSEVVERAVGGEAERGSLQELQLIHRELRSDSLLADTPPHTRSKIKLAYEEPELTSKTTGLGKLFREDSSPAFPVVPGEGEGVDGLKNVEDPVLGVEAAQPVAPLLSPVSPRPANLDLVPRKIQPVVVSPMSVERAPSAGQPVLPAVPSAGVFSPQPSTSLSPEPTPLLFPLAVTAGPAYRGEQDAESLVPGDETAHRDADEAIPEATDEVIPKATDEAIHEAAVYAWPVQHAVPLDEVFPKVPPLVAERRNRLTPHDSIASESMAKDRTDFARESEDPAAMLPQPRVAAASTMRPAVAPRFASQAEESLAVPDPQPLVTDPQSSRFNAISKVGAAVLLPRKLRDEAEERFTNAFSSEPIRPRQDRGRTELPFRNSLDSAVGRRLTESAVRTRMSRVRVPESAKIAPETPLELSADERDAGLPRRWSLLCKFEEEVAPVDQTPTLRAGENS